MASSYHIKSYHTLWVQIPALPLVGWENGKLLNLSVAQFIHL